MWSTRLFHAHYTPGNRCTFREACPEITDDESEKFEAALHELCMEAATAIQVALNMCAADRAKEKARAAAAAR